MKTMKLLRVAIVCASLSASAAFASPAEDLARIAALSAELNTNGIAGMLALATRNGLKAPWMPEQWHVENVIKGAEPYLLSELNQMTCRKCSMHTEKANSAPTSIGSVSTYFRSPATPSACGKVGPPARTTSRRSWTDGSQQRRRRFLGDRRSRHCLS